MSHNPLALIVGGSRGIGSAIALRLARSGFNLWLTYRSDDTAAAAIQTQVQATGRSCDLMRFDIADYEATQAALAARAQETPPDAVVFNAGIVKDSLAFWMPKADWDAVLGTNLNGFYNLVKAVVGPMIGERKGRIVAITSLSGEVGQAGQLNYSASKAGLIGAVKALAREVGPKGIIVNAVSPGVIETDMTTHAAGAMQSHLPAIPLRRFGRAEEVASLVNFLCAEPDMYIHGQVLSVNGGLSMT